MNENKAMAEQTPDPFDIDVLSLFKCKMLSEDVIDDETGNVLKMWKPAPYPQLQVYGSTKDSTILTGWWRSRGNKEGQYPQNYFKLINTLFGREPNTLEVCSRYVQVDGIDTAATVDIKPPAGINPTYRCNAENLAGIPSLTFGRVREDPPYTRKWAQEVYGNDGAPNFAAMLKSAARVVKIGGLIFMLMGQGCVEMGATIDKPMHSGNLQECKPYGLKRFLIICISVVPNKEYRFLNGYVKVAHPEILERNDFGSQTTFTL